MFHSYDNPGKTKIVECVNGLGEKFFRPMVQKRYFSNKYSYFNHSGYYGYNTHIVEYRTYEGAEAYIQEYRAELQAKDLNSMRNQRTVVSEKEVAA